MASQDEVQQLKHQVQVEVDRLTPDLVAVSRFLHANPELAYEERQAAELLTDVLEQHGFTHVSQTKWSRFHDGWTVNVENTEGQWHLDTKWYLEVYKMRSVAAHDLILADHYSNFNDVVKSLLSPGNARGPSTSSRSSLPGRR